MSQVQYRKGEQMDLLDAVFGSSLIQEQIAPKQTEENLPQSGEGPYVIFSITNGYWRQDHGWVTSKDNATRFTEVQASPHKVFKWHFRGGRYLKKKGAWYWVSREGGLGRHKGADYDGPFPSPEEAAIDCINTFGVGAPQLDTPDAQFVCLDEIANH